MDISYTKYELPAGSAPRTPLGYGQTPTDWSNTYGDNKHFHLVGKTDGGVMVAWEDQESNAGFITTLNEFTSSSVQLTMDKGSKLGCAVEGEPGEFFYVTFETNTNLEAKLDSVDVTMYKAKTDGKVITQSKVDSSKEGLNVYSWGNSDSCHLVYEPKRPFLAMHYSRTNTQSSDGLNHQSAGLIFFDTSSLKVTPGEAPDWATKTN